ncbi:MAG: nuclear transport factor 2 family protein [Steroidobacteraceae bacterium]|nr:nuclear transport factor 2 family protein [Steroidobacteraceae bacterium]
MVKLVGILLVLSLAVAAPVRAVDKPVTEGPQTDIDAIVAVFGEWGKARDAGDIDGIVAVHHPEMKIITRNKALYAGHAGVRRFYSDHYDRDSKRQLFSNVEEIRVFGKVAFVIGRFLALDVAKDIVDPGYYLIVLRRNDAGDWLIYRDIDTPSPDGLALKPRH